MQPTVAALLLLLSLALLSSGRLFSAHETSRFEQWAERHRKVYTAAERLRRIELFLHNELVVARLNAQHLGRATFALNSFADLTNDEFAQLTRGSSLPRHVLAASVPNETLRTAERRVRDVTPAPWSVDWRSAGAVNAVRNQGGCGSCYSFASTAAIEGSCQLQTGRLYELSEQHIVDCSSTYTWASAGGLNSRADYPYHERDQQCSEVQNKYCRTSGWVQLPKGVEGWKLKTAVAQQPVDITLNAGTDSFKFYKSGILSSDCPDGEGHEIVIVGYGDSNGAPYWIARNSWSSEWGEGGYIRLARSDASGSGICGLQNWAIFPLIATSSWWVRVNNGAIPQGAIEGGKDQGWPVYVARASYQNILIPGKALAWNGATMYVGYGGSEVALSDFEVLVGTSPRWVTVYAGYALHGGSAGTDLGGNPLWVARISYNGAMTLGKAGNHLWGIYIPYGGKEINISDQPYEVLLL
eukprot:m51a1_g8302 putative xylem cysteine proteinase 1-like (469) ;mRNA; f:43175-44846